MKKNEKDELRGMVLEEFKQREEKLNDLIQTFREFLDEIICFELKTNQNFLALLQEDED